MIGVFCKKDEQPIVEEFFQLFKTPWEFYREGYSYEVVISTRYQIPTGDSRLLVLYNGENNQFDSEEKIISKPKQNSVTLEYPGIEIPVYGKSTTFGPVGRPFIYVKEKSEVAGFQINQPQRKILRIGYDLFQEVSYLLSKGQPIENALIPTLDGHISLLRSCIVKTGIPLIEIPAIPAGHRFITCLTHDVDFVGIRMHKFDHTMWGFLYRALIASLRGVLNGRWSLNKILKNYKAALSLPLIYLGLARDFWFQFDRYIEIENGVKSTFFIIPFKNRVGQKMSVQHQRRRATRYDIDDIRDVVKKLVHDGYEIAVHGIDAWNSVELAHRELKRISEVTGQSEVGIRMHWLCFDGHSPKILDKVGFQYDSTLGYNEAVGYRVGTTQVFQPFGMNDLLELPLHIQDLALISPNQRGLTETQAWEKCISLFRDFANYGGVLTILWHLRSIAPERLLEDFYIRLLKELKNRNVWFATAGQVVKWFRMRRALNFEKASFSGNRLYVSLNSNGNEPDPQFMIRVHLPVRRESISGESHQRYVDVPWSGDRNVEISLII